LSSSVFAAIIAATAHMLYVATHHASSWRDLMSSPAGILCLSINSVEQHVDQVAVTPEQSSLFEKE